MQSAEAGLDLPDRSNELVVENILRVTAQQTTLSDT